MSRVEQAGYPYVPGSHGIPFCELPLESRGVVVGGSGKPLYYEAYRRRISAIDNTDGQMLGLFAKIFDGAMSLNLQTRLHDDNVVITHPDLFAAKFVKMALVNFQRYENIGCIVGKWHPGSVNYDAFQVAKAATGDALLAAKSTWTGKIAALNGYTELNPDDMIEDNEMGNSYVRVIFRRPR